MDNKNQPNDNSSQNELDLGFNQTDSVTPRKPVQQSGSIFDKAKGLLVKKNSQIHNSMFVANQLLVRQQANLFHLLKYSKVKILNNQCNQVLSALKSPLKMFKWKT